MRDLQACMHAHTRTSNTKDGRTHAERYWFPTSAPCLSLVVGSCLSQSTVSSSLYVTAWASSLCGRRARGGGRRSILKRGGSNHTSLHVEKRQHTYVPMSGSNVISTASAWPVVPEQTAKRCPRVRVHRFDCDSCMRTRNRVQRIVCMCVPTLLVGGIGRVPANVADPVALCVWNGMEPINSSIDTLTYHSTRLVWPYTRTA